MHVYPPTTRANRLYLNLHSLDRYQERKSLLQAMVCLVNLKNTNFGLQKDKPTNMAVLEHRLHLKGWHRKGGRKGLSGTLYGSSEHLSYTTYTTETMTNHKKGSERVSITLALF